MEKLTKEEMKAVTGGTTGNLWTCDNVHPFCHNGDPTLHTDGSCSDYVSCTMGPVCGNPYFCP